MTHVFLLEITDRSDFGKVVKKAIYASEWSARAAALDFQEGWEARDENRDYIGALSTSIALYLVRGAE